MSRSRALLAGLALLAHSVAGCSSPVGSLAPSLRATAVAPTLILQNDSHSDIRYQVLESGFATSALIACGDAVGSPLPSRSGISLPYDAITGYTAEARTAVVYWWAEDQSSCSRVSSLRVTLPE